MQVHRGDRTGPLVQVVDVLGDEGGTRGVGFDRRHGQVSGVRLGMSDDPASPLVPAPHELRVRTERLWGGQLLGVELPPEGVPPMQNKIVTKARQAGKPVVVATQMLESMIVSPTPTRAEVSDVANAIYEGADAVMLSAESAAGQYPVEAVAMMDKIGQSVEADPVYSRRVHFIETPAEETIADALSESAAQIVRIIGASAMACYTTSGSTARACVHSRKRG